MNCCICGKKTIVAIVSDILKVSLDREPDPKGEYVIESGRAVLLDRPVKQGEKRFKKHKCHRSIQ